MGKIELTVCAARNLYNMQHIGVPDPFVRLITGDKKYKTKVVEDTLSPEWNETFRFQIADEMSTQIRLEVWNKCTYSDDLMGLYTFSLGGLVKGIVKDGWYILDKSKTQAEIHVRVLAVDFGEPPKPEELWMVAADINRDPVQRAIEDGTWRPGQKNPPPPSGPPQAQYVQAPPQQQQQAQIIYAQPSAPAAQQPYPPPVQYVQQPPQQPGQYAYAAQPAVQYVQQQPQAQPVYYAPQPQLQPQPPVMYYQQGPPLPQQQPAMPYQQGPPPPPQGYYAQQPSYGY